MKQINSLRKIAELVDRRNIPGDYDLNVLYNKEIKSKEKEEEKILMKQILITLIISTKK